MYFKPLIVVGLAFQDKKFIQKSFMILEVWSKKIKNQVFKWVTTHNYINPM